MFSCFLWVQGHILPKYSELIKVQISGATYHKNWSGHRVCNVSKQPILCTGKHHRSDVKSWWEMFYSCPEQHNSRSLKKENFRFMWCGCPCSLTQHFPWPCYSPSTPLYMQDSFRWDHAVHDDKRDNDCILATLPQLLCIQISWHKNTRIYICKTRFDGTLLAMMIRMKRMMMEVIS